jgi:hypothetical protein
VLLCVRDLLARLTVHRPAVGIVGIIATVTDLFHDPAVVRVYLGPVLITDSEALKAFGGLGNIIHLACVLDCVLGPGCQGVGARGVVRGDIELAT